MDLCAPLALLAVILLLVAAVGHALWQAGAAILEVLFGDPGTRRRRRLAKDQRPPRQICIRCATPFPGDEPACPACGLDPTGAVAQQLRHIETTVSEIQALVHGGKLDAAVGEQIYRGLEAKQTALLEGRASGAEAPAAGGESIAFALPATAPGWKRLERLLTTCRDIRNLTFANRKQALAWYRQVAEDDLPRMSAASLLALARLLRMAALVSRALRVYDLLCATHARTAEAGEGALEAARFAAREHKPEELSWFLEQTRKHSYSPADQEEIERLERVAAKQRVPRPLPAMTPVPPAQEPVVVAEAVTVEPLDQRGRPRRPWSEMLAAFMEEKNILWGELVGGLLIVGCSIALVISLWQTLEEIPYFPFLIFAAITAALFGAGLYTLSHWKLEATSRGLLVIATLLTPLDFFILAGLSRGRQAGLVDVAIELVAIAGFAFFVWRSARILMRPTLGGRADLLLTIAILGASANQLLVPRWLELAEPILWLFVLLSLVPVIVHGLAGVAVWYGVQRRAQLDRSAANGLFLFLGQSGFAAAVALALLVYWSEDTLTALRHLALPISLGAVPLVLCGALIQSRLDTAEGAASEAAPGLSTGTVRLAGTIVALMGTSFMLGAIALAWPRTPGLLLVGLVNAAAFATVGLAYRLPFAHIPALGCLTIAYLTAFHALLGATEDTIPSELRLFLQFVDPVSSSALVILAALMASVSEALVRVGHRRDGVVYLCGSAALGALAILLLSRGGVWVPERSVFVFGVCAAGMLIVNLRWRVPGLTFVAAFCLFMTVAYVLVALEPSLESPRLSRFALLIMATLALTSSLLLLWVERWRSLPWLEPTYVQPLGHAGVIASGFGAVYVLFVSEWHWLAESAACALWLAALWLTLALGSRSPKWFAACQGMLALAAVFGTTAWLVHQEWASEAWRDLWLPRNLQVYLLSLSTLGLGWIMLRRVNRTQRLRELLEPGWPMLDLCLLGAVVIAHYVVSVVAVWPHVLQELGPVAPHLSAGCELYDLGSAWIVSAILALTLILTLRETFAPLGVIGIAIVGLTLPLQVAQAFHADLATASALRWALAIAFILMSAMLWMRVRLIAMWRPLFDASSSSGRKPAATASVLRGLLLGGAVAPLLLLTVVVAAMGFAGGTPAGPLDGSLFASLGWMPSMLAPLVLVAIGLAGHGVREEAAEYIFAAGLVLLATITGGYALHVTMAGDPLDEAQTVILAQLGIIAAALWGFAWLWSGRWRSLPLLSIQVALGPILALLVLGSAALHLLLLPGGPHPAFVAEAGGLLGWLGLLAAAAVGVWWLGIVAPSAVVHGVGAGGVLLGITAACAAAAWGPGSWQPYHVLTLAWTLLGLLMLAAGWAGASMKRVGPGFWSAERRARAAVLLKRWIAATPARRWVEAISLVVVLLALRGAWEDPARPYGSTAATVTVILLLAALAVWTRQARYVYASGLLFSVVGYVLWQAWLIDELDLDLWIGLGQGLFDRFVSVQILCLATASLLWSLAELGLRRRSPPVDLRGGSIPFTHAAAWVALHLAGILILVGVTSNLIGADVKVGGGLLWLALALTASALFICLWDAEARLWALPEAPLYVLGLLTIGLGLHELNLDPWELARRGAVAIGGYVLAVSVVVWLAPRWAGLRRILPWRAEDAWLWFLPAQGVLSAVVLILGLWITLDFDRLAERLSGPLAAALALLTCAATTAWCGRHPQGSRTRLGAWRRAPEIVTVSVAAYTGVLLAWALLDPNVAAPWLHRSVLLLAVLTVLAAAYVSRGAGVLSREGDWAEAARSVGFILLRFAGVVLGLVLIQEFALYDPSPEVRRTPLVLPAVILVAGLLGAVLIGGLWTAVSRRNPLALQPRARRATVYGAEVLLVLLLVHLRLNVPDLFPSFLGRHWAFVLMTLGFVGVGLGELFRRRGLDVLAQPLQRTGLFLPLVPLVAFLARPLAELRLLGDVVPGLHPILRYLDRLPEQYALHSLLWFLLGLLYTLVAVLRRSSVFGLLAALAANFGLWVIYAQHEGLRILLHPQLWLVPIGLVLLAAEHLNRDHLSKAQSNSARYLGLLIIYVSSTADMFITGLGESVLLPIVLAVLAILGVLGGILLRVRAFLFLGLVFLFLVIFAQIWHAAVDRAQTWVWWASGIVLGAMILTLFALFEKRRNDVLKMIEDIKRWE